MDTIRYSLYNKANTHIQYKFYLIIAKELNDIIRFNSKQACVSFIMKANLIQYSCFRFLRDLWFAPTLWDKNYA